MAQEKEWQVTHEKEQQVGQEKSGGKEEGAANWIEKEQQVMQEKE